MHITPRHPQPVAGATSVDDDLRDLEIEGYRVTFTSRVALLPVDLVEDEPSEGRS